MGRRCGTGLRAREGRTGVGFVRCLVAFGDDVVHSAGLPDGWMGRNVTRSWVTVGGLTEELVDSAGKSR